MNKTEEWKNEKQRFSTALQQAIDARRAAWAHVHAQCGQAMEITLNKGPNWNLGMLNYNRRDLGWGWHETEPDVTQHWSVTLEALKKETQWLLTLSAERWEMLWQQEQENGEQENV